MSVPASFNRTSDGVESLVLLGASGHRIVPATHANYDRIKELVLNGDGSEKEVYALVDAATAVADTLRRLSTRVTLKGSTIYVDGDRVDDRLTQHIVDMIKGDDDNWPGYVAFLENLIMNTPEGREGLFLFLDKNGLVITPDGCFVGYKGVTREGKSISSGVEDVTITHADGSIEVVRGQIPYAPGDVVEMARSLVDPNRSVGCSVGLHVGTYTYAQGYATGGHLLKVEVNPRDVVETPSEGGGEKMRVCRLKVLELHDGQPKIEGTSYDPMNASEDHDPDSELYDDTGDDESNDSYIY